MRDFWRYLGRVFWNAIRGTLSRARALSFIAIALLLQVARWYTGREIGMSDTQALSLTVGLCIVAFVIEFFIASFRMYQNQKLIAVGAMQKLKKWSRNRRVNGNQKKIVCSWPST